jgi:alcohol-forming fatty acyl-CoA reductase
MDKVSPVYGEISKPNFGLSQQNLRKVVENTEVIFHLASSLDTTLTLKPNVMMNLVGTKSVLELAKQMKKLLQMVHLSTVVYNVEPEIVYEKVYDMPHDPEDLIRLAEDIDEKAMETMKKDLLGQHPNSHSFTKRLAEILVQREYGKLPVAIVRPPMILPSIEEPLPGWADSSEGFSRVCLANGRGVLRSVLADPQGSFHVLPVDTCVNSMLVIAKVLATQRQPEEIPVFHLTDDKFKLKVGWTMDKINNFCFKFPLSLTLW